MQLTRAVDGTGEFDGSEGEKVNSNPKMTPIVTLSESRYRKTPNYVQFFPIRTFITVSHSLSLRPVKRYFFAASKSSTFPGRANCGDCAEKGEKKASCGAQPGPGSTRSVKSINDGVGIMRREGCGGRREEQY